MDNVYEWFSGLATPGGVAYFLFGFMFAFIARWIYCRAKHQELRIPWQNIGITIGVSAIVVVSLQSSEAYSTAKQTAVEVQACQKEFNAALRQRAQINDENEELSQTQRLIVFNWIHNLIFPPPPYSDMPTSDPERQAYGYGITIETEKRFQRSIDRQKELTDERARNPLPDPTCGK